MRRTTPRVVTEREQLQATLLTDPIRSAYMLGDLEPEYADMCTWYGAGDGERLEALVLVYTGLSLPVVITHGTSGALEDVATAFADELPGRTLMHLQPHHVAALAGVFETERLVPTLRMGLAAPDFRPVADDRWSLEPLSHRHTGELVELYSTLFPDHFFEPAQLDSGHYYGIRVGAQLVSIAGVHVYGRTGSVAVLGNIFTHPDHRGLGMSTACTSHLCQRLIDEGIGTLALNVRRQNLAAVRVYERLGFRYHDTFHEGIVVKA